jgi:hypothetical protein
VAVSTVTLYDTEFINNIESDSPSFSGSEGEDFALQFKRLAINYKNMLIRGGLSQDEITL